MFASYCLVVLFMLLLSGARSNCSGRCLFQTLTAAWSVPVRETTRCDCRGSSLRGPFRIQNAGGYIQKTMVLDVSASAPGPPLCPTDEALGSVACGAESCRCGRFPAKLRETRTRGPGSSLNDPVTTLPRSVSTSRNADNERRIRSEVSASAISTGSAQETKGSPTAPGTPMFAPAPVLGQGHVHLVVGGAQQREGLLALLQPGLQLGIFIYIYIYNYYLY